jgi:predicted dehydrogenase
MDSMEQLGLDRRRFLRTAGAALSGPVLGARGMGANSRVAVGFIGMGAMGTGNLKFAMEQGVRVAAVCDVKQDALEKALELAKAGGQAPRAQRDFREILADKSIDAVCIAAPDHWHAYMMVEACKAGKDVWVEKPVCTVLDEGLKMVQAARKYNRVVQAGTMQRSGIHFQQAVDFLRAGKLGKITFARTFNYLQLKREGNGIPPDSAPPPGIDWDLWLGPAPWHAYNPVRSAHEFRRYWDYAGGMMTDWGVHWLDIVQMTLEEVMPETVTAMGGKFWVTDDRETPDTLQALFNYPGGVLASYECRAESTLSPSGKSQGIIIHGSLGMMYLDRSGYRVIPEKGTGFQEIAVKSSNQSNLAHWANFLECVRTRQKPISDIEVCFRTTATCLLGNVAYRSGLRLTWDAQRFTVREEAAQRYLTREYRKPWKLEV